MRTERTTRRTDTRVAIETTLTLVTMRTIHTSETRVAIVTIGTTVTIETTKTLGTVVTTDVFVFVGNFLKRGIVEIIDKLHEVTTERN